MAFLHDFLRLSAAEGADGLLIEYEDMFPFEGRLANASARNAYSKDEIKQILIWAKEAGLHVIPLVQTFGHLEYVLKLAEFRHLRELRSFPQELCPSNPESMELVRDILQQVMALHTPDTRFLHMGCDEVFHLNACGRCTQRALSSTQLFVEHVANVARLVRSLFPGVKPLIWDDMMRSIPPSDFPDLELSTLVEPVVWAYKTISPSIRDFTWFTYGRTFPRVWAAAAFRGASGAAAYAPNVTERFHNVWDWRRRQLAQGAGEPAPAPAVLVLTGWARYDHFAVLTELLPMSVPSLVLALHVARALRLPPRDKVADDDGVVLRLLVEWRRSLSCPVEMLDMPLNNYDPYQWTLVDCSFMGVDVFRVVMKCQAQLYRADIFQRKLNYVVGWMTAYHRERGWSSPARALQVLNGDWPGRIGAAGLRARLEECRNETESVLLRYVDAHAIAEWVAQRILPAEKAMRELELDAVRMTEEDEWPRRPID